MGNTNVIRHHPQLATNEAIISLGSNWGDSHSYLLRALREISSFSKILEQTDIIITTPYEYLQQPFFLNQLIKIQTDLTPQQLLHKLQTIEKICNRQRNIKNGPRTLDLDIIYFANIVSNNKNLTLPHPGIKDRKYLQTLLKNFI